MAAAAPLILVTGATGFVGRHVLDALAVAGCRLRLIVREGKQAQVSRATAIETVLTTPDIWAAPAAWWEDACRGVDTVIHIAWYAEPGKYLQSPKNLDCLAGTLRLAQAASRAKVRRFVGIGTCFEYDLERRPSERSIRRCGRRHLMPPRKPPPSWRSRNACRSSGVSNLPGAGCSISTARARTRERLVPYLRGQAQGRRAGRADQWHAGPRLSRRARGRAA